MSPVASAESSSPVPLCVDLDGTLIRTDLLWESLLILLKKNPLLAFAVPFWWAKGRAHLKAQIASRVRVDPSYLPYHEPLLDYLRTEKARGRRLLLVTASDAQLAQDVADHVGLFSEVLASNGQTNLRGKNKAAKLAEDFGERGYDYAGNSSVDLPVWRHAREALVVNAAASLATRAADCATVGKIFERRKPLWRSLVESLRPHQWVKNLIIFVPLVTSHQLAQWPRTLEAIWAFLAFSVCASAVYVLNDLSDLEADRHHSLKRLRPFAAGDLPLPFGFVLVPLLLAAGILIACVLPAGFSGVLAIYLALTTGYSWRLKQVPLVDVFCLAGLYTIRLIAGHEAASVEFSFWLLVFSMFLFLSLALVKRFVELHAARRQNLPEIHGRGYAAHDFELVAILGPVSGYLAALVLALYVNSPEVRLLYRHPTVLLGVCALLLYWISRVWLLAHRGQMHGDPVVFALKDPASYVVGALTFAVLWLAT
jgi:4-hydroxybenzoate polyprenyltransferase/phosphoserine phosphatase